ncbi:MAG: hypothetical protein EAZ97_05425 [Bacteroidetes bacterium]|nr:MAG: hypothetical protein EAZ97_05425 [Bacteroidota bacterium]
MEKIKHWIRNYFGFTIIETNGFLVLAILMLILILTPMTLKTFFKKRELSNIQDVALLNQTVAQIESQEKNNDFDQKKQYFAEKTEEKTVNVELFAFNPNEIGEEEWEKLGIPKFLAKRIENFKSKAGKFRYKEDLQKIYDFPPETYEKLASYIELPSKSEKFDSKTNDQQNLASNEKQKSDAPANKYAKKEAVIFDLNQADTSVLKQIKGIGTVLSERIVSFREKLGGFYSLEQLNDVYGISPETVLEIKKYARLNKDAGIKKVNINSDNFKHLYLPYNVFKTVNSYRKQHGNFSKPEDLLKTKVVDEKILEKISPYLSF